MELIGTVESLWRYPVKSMRGEELREAFLGFAGVYGDRIYAFRDAAAPKGFPYLTGREQEAMLLYRPVFRQPECAAKPANLTDAEALAPGLTPVYAQPAELMVDVKTPSGERLSVDDPRLIGMLRESIRRMLERHAPREQMAKWDEEDRVPRALMEQIRDHVRRIQDEESRLLVARQTAVTATRPCTPSMAKVRKSA